MIKFNKILYLHCVLCWHDWAPRLKWPDKCPGCRRSHWCGDGSVIELDEKMPIGGTQLVPYPRPEKKHILFYEINKYRDNYKYKILPDGLEITRIS